MSKIQQDLFPKSKTDVPYYISALSGNSGTRLLLSCSSFIFQLYHIFLHEAHRIGKEYGEDTLLPNQLVL